MNSTPHFVISLPPTRDEPSRGTSPLNTERAFHRLCTQSISSGVGRADHHSAFNAVHTRLIAQRIHSMMVLYLSDRFSPPFHVRIQFALGFEAPLRLPLLRITAFMGGFRYPILKTGIFTTSVQLPLTVLYSVNNVNAP